jgi:DNA-binding MarR family transcriptional regulator
LPAGNKKAGVARPTAEPGRTGPIPDWLDGAMGETTPPGPGFDADAVARLRRSIGRLARAMNQSAASEDLTPTQASVLAVVVAHERVGLSALARVEGLNPTLLSRVVSKLEGLGLIERAADEDDQRAVVARATAAGREKDARIRARRTDELLGVLGRLPPATAAALLAALPAFEELTDAIREPAAAGRRPAGAPR